MPIPPRTPLLTLLTIEQERAAYVKKVFEQSANQLDAQLRKMGTKGNPLTRMQVEAQRAAVHAVLQEDFSVLGKAIASGQEGAARAASRVVSLYEEQLTALVASKSTLSAIATSEAQRAASGIEAALRRMEGSSYVPLSRSVYKTHQLSLKLVDKKIDQGLLSGWTSRQMAKEVSSLINPNVKGGVSYAANRLARTEINNAFHASSAKRYEDSPIVEGVDWHLSSSHPEGDICDDLAAGSPYRKKNVPRKPHPHCYCFITPALPTEEEFLKNLFAGKYGDEPWAKKASPAKVKTVGPRLPTDDELAKMTTAAVKREYAKADEAFWSFRRKWDGNPSDMYNSPVFAELKERYDFWAKAERARVAAARAAAAAKKAAAKAQAVSQGMTVKQIATAKKIAATQAKLAKAGLPRFKNDIVKPNNLGQARSGANPRGIGWQLEDKRPTSRKSYEEVVAERDYQINCTRVAAAMEMRMRGWDVSATGAGQKLAFSKSDGWIESNWIDPKTGKFGKFSTVKSAQQLEQEMVQAAQGQEGARFFIVTTWKNGGGHIFNAEVRNGRVEFFEGQTQTTAPGRLKEVYLYNMAFNPEGVRDAVRWMRVDTLEPTDEILGRPSADVPPWIEPNPLR